MKKLKIKHIPYHSKRPYDRVYIDMSGLAERGFADIYIVCLLDDGSRMYVSDCRGPAVTTWII